MRWALNRLATMVCEKYMTEWSCQITPLEASRAS